jgi:hypothetical protein
VPPKACHTLRACCRQRRKANDMPQLQMFIPTKAEPLTIDCECCALRETSACDDCVVTFLLGREPDDAVVIDADEARAMRMLEHAGLVPSLRFSTRAG